MHLDLLYPALFILALGAVPSGVHAAKTPKNAILLSEVQSLTLYGDKPTTHRRVSAVPQLKCISSKAICALHKIDTMRCVNQGAGYFSEDIQWSCTASLPVELKLGSTDVICEGYSSSEDPYVLKGSCGVEYRLILTDQGEARYPNLAGSGFNWGGGGENSGGGLWSWLFWLTFIAVLIWIVYAACGGEAAVEVGPRAERPPVRRNNFWGGGDDGWGGGGGGGGGWGPGWGGGGGGGGAGGRGNTDPPPPYSGPTSVPKNNTTSSEGWRPGFWSGLAGGAAAGYMAGNRGRNNNANRNAGGSTWGGPGGAGPSGWGSGSGSGSGSSSGSSSGANHDSTGFGSTSRR